jgi:hypothetical protein
MVIFCPEIFFVSFTICPVVLYIVSVALLNILSDTILVSLEKGLGKTAIFFSLNWNSFTAVGSDTFSYDIIPLHINILKVFGNSIKEIF